MLLNHGSLFSLAVTFYLDGASGDIYADNLYMFYSARIHLYLLLCVSVQNHMGYLTNQNAQVAMCNFPSVKDAADVAIATMRSGVQVGF